MRQPKPPLWEWVTRFLADLVEESRYGANHHITVEAFAVFLLSLGSLFVFGASARGFVTSGSGVSGSGEVGDLKARTPTQVAC